MGCVIVLVLEGPGFDCELFTDTIPDLPLTLDNSLIGVKKRYDDEEVKNAAETKKRKAAGVERRRALKKQKNALKEGEKNDPKGQPTASVDLS